MARTVLLLLLGSALPRLEAALRSIVRRDTGEDYQEFVRGLAEASGVPTPTKADVARFDRKRKKKLSNKEWENRHDPDAEVTKMKDGRTHLAYKMRSYVAESDRGRRRWKGKKDLQAIVYANRRRIRGNRGKWMRRQRRERLERPFAARVRTPRSWSRGLVLATLALVAESVPAQPLEPGPLPPLQPSPTVFCLTSGTGRPGGDIAVRTEAQQERNWCAGLNYQQDPPILTPAHDGRVSFRDIGIVGDFPTVQFESEPVLVGGKWVRLTESWQRTHTDSVAGYTISYFTKTWPAEEMQRLLGAPSFGVDDPNIGLGTLGVPGQPGALGQPTPYLMLRVAPVDFPAVPVNRINDLVQYSSHLVNLRVDSFSVGRIDVSNQALQFREAANLFYVYFPDDYDSLAFVTQRLEMGIAGGLYTHVRNDVEGIGLPIVDETSSYGSGGRLKGIEYYGSAWIANNHISSHELMHQWADFFKLHEIARVDASGTHFPDNHMPLLFPRESFVSAAAQRPHIEVVRSSDGLYRRAIVPAPRQHPLHLYAMGLAPASSVPELLVFEEQRRGSDPGEVVAGGTRAVTMDDIVARHGPRVGPVAPSEWRRAVVVVSTESLLSQEEMNFWNFIAKRLSEPSDVTDFFGVPSFSESVNGSMELRTEIAPKDAPKLEWREPTTLRPYSPRAWADIEFDEPVDTAYVVDRPYTFDGRVADGPAILTLSGETREDNYGGRTTFSASRTVGADGRFSVTVRFPQAGSYVLRTRIVREGEEQVLSSKTGILVEDPGVPDPAPDREYTDCAPTSPQIAFDHGYQVSACFEYQRDGLTVTEEASDFRLDARESGLLYFFDRDNAEILIKVLDACGVNGHRWVFVAPVTDLALNLEVLEVASGRRWRYRNPRGGRTAATKSDTAAFPCDATAASWAVAGSNPGPGGLQLAGSDLLRLAAWPLGASGRNASDRTGVSGLPQAAASGEGTDCVPGGPALTLRGGYTVRMCYETADDMVGDAKDWGLDSSQSGLLYFFDRDNVEVLIKVLDGCALNGHRWVFVAPVTDLAFNLFVDGPGGERWTHTNRLGQTAEARRDTSAFACTSV